MSNNNNVRVLIAGHTPHHLEIIEGETLGAFRSRNNRPGVLPLSQVATFHVNGAAADMSYVLRPGDIIGGALEAKGG